LAANQPFASTRKNGYHAHMQTVTITEARKDLSRLIEQAGVSHEPVFIKGRHAEAVLISKKDWSGIQEMRYLDSIPGMMKSIIDGINTPVEDCVKELSW